MCGIAGFIDPSLNSDDAQAYISKMLQSISHRGPDNTSVWKELPVVLGHNRLTIIDLSDAANQPMNYREACIIYNGEIYNYIEIRKELEDKGYVFKTASDTEVIIASYYEWGTKCVERFVGMWAFAIWNSKEKLLFCSRDRFGIKPFNYIHSNGKFYFGSEYRALKSSPLFSNELNLNQVKRGLQLGWICYDDETYFDKIKAIPAAHNLIFKDGKISLERYWDIETGKDLNISFNEKKEMFYQLFFNSIRLHMRSDVPVASCLSGGLDSSSIVSCIKNIFPGAVYKTFSVFYSGQNKVDERPFIYEVLKKYDGIEPYYFSPTNKEVEEYFHKISDCVEVPLSGSSYISQYFLMKLIGDHKIKVVLDGQGSDEYLAGYMHTFYRLVADYFKKISLSKAITTTFAVNKNLDSSFSKTMLHFGKSMLCVLMDEQGLYSLEYKNYFPFLFTNANSEPPFSLPEKNGNAVTNFLYHLLFTTSLPSLLHYEDRTSMAYSIESRVPFLDHRLVEFCFQLNNEDKIKEGQTKYILREALSGILPDAIKNRRDKKGFVTPGEIEWLRGPLKFLVEGNFNNLDFLNQEKVMEIMKSFNRGENKYANLVWRLAVLNNWIGKN